MLDKLIEKTNQLKARDNDIRRMRNTINRNIRNLSKVINFRDHDMKWQNEWKEDGVKDRNMYFWFHCGEREKYEGKMESLIELRDSFKKPKFAKRNGDEE